MSSPTNNPATEGAPCWFELGTTDQNSAKAFYQKLFGWTAQDSPLPDGSTYSMFFKDSGSIGAAFTLMPELLSKGVPPHWGVYFRASNVDDTTTKAVELGGSIKQPAFDVMEHGRMSVLADPEGAVFSLWQPKAHPGATLYGVMNAICWCELATQDNVRAESYYKDLFGWEMKPSPGMPYTEFSAGGRWVGGIMKMDAEWKGIPAHWGIYVMVDDSDSIAEQTKTLGGKVKHGPFDAPGVGRIAILADPQGAVFSVIKLAHPA